MPVSRFAVFRGFKGGSSTPATPFLIPINKSINFNPSNASFAYLTVPGNCSLKSCSTYERVNAAPPRTIGHFSAIPLLSNSCKFSFIITVDLTNKPDIPITSTSFFNAASIISFAVCLIPMFTVS